MTLAVNIAQGGSNNVTFRNKIINGACVIDQRNAGASFAQTNGAYNLDRWFGNSYTGGSTTGKYTVQRNAGSLTPPVGFVNYLGVTSTAATSSSATDIYTIQQSIEGYNIADLMWGTANAKTITISFQVYASVTGTFGGILRNDAGNRSYPFTYTISSTNTWTAISITIAGDTTGTWEKTTSAGISVYFQLQVGSNFTYAANSWNSSGGFGANSCVNLLTSNGAYWYITGVQLEAGTTASPFEYRQYGTELALCQRYYYRYTPLLNSVIGRGYNTAGNVVMTRFSFPVTMRANPTSTLYGSWSLVNVATLSISEYDTSGISVSMTVSGSADAYFYASTTAQYFDCASEL